jgi:transcriptional regulator with XRE-family HTH domain
MSDTQIIGARVRDLRKARGRSQEELGELLKLDKSAISRVESGQRGLAVQELALLAPFLGVSVDEILFGAAADDTLLLRGEGDATEAAAYAERVIDDFQYVTALLP